MRREVPDGSRCEKIMSLKKNVLASYLSQFYVTIIGIVMVPLYIRYMGAEAYGLVGLFSMLQAWFQLLDMGLTPTMARATANYRGGEAEGRSLRVLFRTLEGIFLATGLIGFAAIAIFSHVIATQWLRVENLTLDQVREAIALIGAVVSLRWASGLYRGVIVGHEQIVWLSSFNAAIATTTVIYRTAPERNSLLRLIQPFLM